MENIFVGEYIRLRRRELKLTQEQLCGGICDFTTLSRIENGHHAPSRSKLNALLQRLGMPEERYYAISTKNELEIEALKKEIMGCNTMDRIAEGFEKLVQLESLAEPDDLLIKQFILRSKAWLGKKDKRYSPQERLELLLQAIHLTRPNVELSQIDQFLYTFDEVKIINQIALVYSDMEQHSTALDIYCQLLQYVREHYKEVLPTSGLLQLVLHNYARELGIVGHYDESIKIAEEGRKACIQYGHFQYLPGCLAIIAECCFFQKQYEKSISYYKQAYYIYKAIDDTSNLKIIVNEAQKYLNLSLED